MDNLINSEVPNAGPAWGALIALRDIGTSERTQGWFPKQLDHGMYLLGEPLDKVRKFQTHAVRLAMETGIWAARCRMIHPCGTTGISSRKDASDEYAATLERSYETKTPAHHEEIIHGAA